MLVSVCVWGGHVLRLLIHTAELERGLWQTVTDAVNHLALQQYVA